MKTLLKSLSVAIGLVLLMPGITGRAQVYADSSIQLDKYLVPAVTPSATPDAQGFLGRWLLLEPISKPNRSNTVFTDSYIREAFAVEYFKGQLGNELPKDGAKVKTTVEYQPPVNLQGGRPSFKREGHQGTGYRRRSFDTRRRARTRNQPSHRFHDLGRLQLRGCGTSFRKTCTG